MRKFRFSPAIVFVCKIIDIVRFIGDLFFPEFPYYSSYRTFSLTSKFSRLFFLHGDFFYSPGMLPAVETHEL